MSALRWLYASAHARRILRGGCVTPTLVAARSWGRGALCDAVRAAAPLAPDLHVRLRVARAHGYTLDALFRAPFPFPAPYA